jgi:hypothetical protein
MSIVEPPREPASELDYFITTLELEARALEGSVRSNPALRPFFTLDFRGKTRNDLLGAYVRLLKIKADYVACTVPMLRAAGEALRGGSAEDRAWSSIFLGYAEDEADLHDSNGHHVWARNDMIALGAPPVLLDAARHPTVAAYSRYFVEEAWEHPYAILGAKGVLEHLSVRVADDLVKGVIAAAIPGAENAVSFFKHHGILDVDHVHAGDSNLVRINDGPRRWEILAGAYFTSGCYRAFLEFAM